MTGKPGEQGLMRIFKAFGYSMAGLNAAWRHEAAFRQECLLALIMIPLAVWLGASALERALMIGSVMLVLIIELVNSALEAVVDRIGPERHELAGRAKDIGSAAVFLSLMNVALVWGIILGARCLG